jgi:hypothetical protein
VTIDLELVISIASALAAIAATAFAYRSNRIAALALELLRREHKAHDATVTPYLIEGIRRTQKTAEVIAFGVTYTNKSDIPNSLVRIELEVHYFTKEGVVAHLLFPLAENPSDAIDLRSLPALRAPVNLGPRTTESGWLIFLLPTGAVKGPTERYRVVALTATGERITMESFLIKTISDAEESNPS